MNGTNLHQNESKVKWNQQSYDHYVAIDWSQVNFAIARSTRKRSEPKVNEWQGNDVRIVKDYLLKLKGQIIMTIEETTTSHWLYVELKDFVDKLVICDPYHNHLLSNGPKTDKIDSRKLCILLRGGLLKEVYHTTHRFYIYRQLLSAYNDLKDAGVRIQNQRSALYRSKGFRYERTKLPELKKQLDGDDFSRYITDWQDKVIAEYESDKEDFQEKISEVVKENVLMKNISKITGIGVISAFEIISIVVQPERFETKGNYLSYCGLISHEKMSGNRSYGRRRPRYNRKLHGVYKRASRIAITIKKGPIYEYYETLIKKNLNHKAATSMVARYLARITLGMMKNGTKYEPYRWRKNEVKDLESTK